MPPDRSCFAMDFDGDDPDRVGFSAKRDSDLSPPIIRVYLAGPLTNNDPNVERECSDVRAVVKKVLTGYEFLGVSLEVYDPGDVTPPGTMHTAEDVYVQDFASTARADLVVFHVNAPSLGVGMEAQIAAFATIPRLVIAKRGSPVSRMFRGVFNPSVGEVEYSDCAELRERLSELLPIIAAGAIESAERRRPIIENLAQQSIGRKILKLRILQDMSIQELARRTDVREFWLIRLETDATFAANVSLAQLGRLAEELDGSPQMNGREIRVKSQAEEELNAQQRLSLENLVTFVQTRGPTVDGNRVSRIWKQYLAASTELLSEAGKFRGESGVEISVDDWRRRYDDAGLF